MVIDSKVALDLCHSLAWQEVHPKTTFLLLSELIKIEEKEFLANLNNKISFKNIIEKNAERELVINQIWSMYSHINSVNFNKEWQEFYPKALEAIENFYLKEVLNKDYFNVVNILLDSEKDKEKIRVLQLIKRDQLLAGVNLNNDKKDKYVELNQKLSNLSEKFRTNVLLSTDNWSYKVDNIDKLVGLDKDFIDSFELNGVWVFDLRDSNYLNILENLKDPIIREDFFKAYKTRASSLWADHSLDNSQNMLDILTLRQEKSRLLGYSNYIDLALQTRCVESKGQIQELLADISKKTEPKAIEEFESIKKFAHDSFGIIEIKPWDVAFLCDKFKEQQTGFSNNDYKKYFLLDKVLDGLKIIVSRLFNLKIVTKDVSSWNESVLCWQILDLDNDVQAVCYLDLFARPGKQSGAWMDECRVRLRSENKTHHPIAFLNCNFSSVTGDVTINHSDVVTLFHEFGHVLNHCLSSINSPYIAGINNIEWDAVEVASQLLERWCWTKEGVDLISYNKDTGDTLPSDMLYELNKLQSFLSATQMMRQLTFCEFDFAIHDNNLPENSAEIYDIYLKIARSKNKVPTWVDDKMPASFGHIFFRGVCCWLL
jgi:oligopeptidase A